MNKRLIIRGARAISMLFTPFYLPLLGLTLLFVFSYLRMLPFLYKVQLLLLVYILTILMPTFLIRLYLKYQGWSHYHLGQRERRMVPYVISILSYFTCFYLTNVLHVPHFTSSILVAALLIQIVCAIINVWWKVSTHSAAIGGVGGALIAYAYLFTFNPVWWLCVVLFFAGLVGSSRMILRQHTLLQVIVGFLTGFICAYFAIMKLSINIII